ncbi:M66 family metalloprotease [Arthrobacter sp. LAPM80]|uniref:M66 family metalloprotease n=1 Tax=Arthrobacter sp. LAPM80 TaxID=3141788 RepID=UPI00398B5737
MAAALTVMVGGTLPAAAMAAPAVPPDAAASVLAAGTASLDIAGVTISGQLSDVTRDVLVNPYTVGEKVNYTFTVKNTRAQSVTVVPASGSFAPFVPADGPGNCRWMNLTAGAGYNCTTAKHTVTAADLATGFFATTTTWQVGADTETLATPAVALRASAATPVGQVSISGTPATPQRNTSASPYAVGEKLTYSFTVRNNGTTAITVEPVAGAFSPFLAADGQGNCRNASLLAGASYTCTTAQHTVTREELDRGYFLPTTSWTAGAASAEVTTDPAKLGIPLEDPLSGYLNAAPADRGVGFHDVDKTGAPRAIRNDLSAGTLSGMVEFAQNHTVNPAGNHAAAMPDLVAERQALLMFTPAQATSRVSVSASVKGVAKGSFDLKPPAELPATDASFPADRPAVVYSKRTWSVDLPWDVVVPGLELAFSDASSARGTLPASNITMAPPSELVINNIELGMLTTPNMSGNHAFINKPAQSAADYFQTIPVSKLVMAKYESVRLDTVIVENGNIYTPANPSVTNGDVYSGDMRESVGKAQVSTGINLANFGMTSGPMNQVQPSLYNQRIIHHSAGLYANGRAEHGLSGGNGMATIYSSSGNELSHELGHSYGLGHYPGQNSSLPGDAATINATHHADSGWGYNAYRDVMRPNLAMGAFRPDGVDINGLPFKQTFGGSYNFLMDAMSGGWVESNYSNYTLHTGFSADLIQEGMKAVVPDLAYPSGYRDWDATAQGYVDAKAKNPAFNYLRPTSVGVPVVTLLGGYVPANPAKAVLYPSLRSNWGNSFDYPAPAQDAPATTRVCWMDVSFQNGSSKKFAVSGGVSGIPAANALQFNINIAQADKPTGAGLFCKQNGTTSQYGNHIDIATDLPAMPAAVTIGQEAGYTAVRDAEMPALQSGLERLATSTLPLLERDSKIALDTWKGDLGLLSPAARTVAGKILGNETAAGNAAKFLRYYQDTAATTATLNRFKDLLVSSALIPDAGTKVVPAGAAIKVDAGNSGIAAGYCLKLYTNPDGSLEARVPTAATLATECTGTANEKWFMDARGAVHSAARPELCLSSSNPSRPANCDISSVAQQWSYQADGHLNSVASPGYSVDLNRATRLPILYQTSGGGNQKWVGLTTSSVPALVLLDAASLKKVGELGL